LLEDRRRCARRAEGTEGALLARRDLCAGFASNCLATLTGELVSRADELLSGLSIDLGHPCAFGVPLKPMNEAWGKRVAHVSREAVDEVVLATVRLVGDHD
jgi:hypothetical protein